MVAMATERMAKSRQAQQRIAALHSDDELFAEGQRALAEIAAQIPPTPREQLKKR